MGFGISGPREFGRSGLHAIRGFGASGGRSGIRDFKSSGVREFGSSGDRGVRGYKSLGFTYDESGYENGCVMRAIRNRVWQSDSFVFVRVRFSRRSSMG